MSLRQDFERRVSLLSKLNPKLLTARLVEFLRWINGQAAIKKILDELKASSPLTPIINSADRERHKRVAHAADYPEAVALVGLYMLEACSCNQAAISTHQFLASQ